MTLHLWQDIHLHRAGANYFIHGISNLYLKMVGKRNRKGSVANNNNNNKTITVREYYLFYRENICNITNAGKAMKEMKK